MSPRPTGAYAGTAKGPQWTKIPSLASWYHSGALCCLIDLRVGWYCTPPSFAPAPARAPCPCDREGSTGARAPSVRRGPGGQPHLPRPPASG